MTDTTYNGWTNRETWAINLHFDGVFAEVFEERNIETLAECIEEYVWEVFDEADIPAVFRDLVDLGSVNWREIAAAVAED